MNGVEVVNDALDAYVAVRRERGKEPYIFRARTLAHIAGVSVPMMSQCLQMYRAADPKLRRYTIGCEGYGAGSPWRIISKPGRDTKTLQMHRARHAKWLAEDVARRGIRDALCELVPGLSGTVSDAVLHTEVDALMDNLQAAAKRMTKVMDRLLDGAA